jgi:addiction module HigA family antidote
MLEEEFLKPLRLTKYRLAKDIGVPPQRIGDIVAGKRAITADTDLRLCRYFGLSDGWWLRGQASYDTAIAKENLRAELARDPSLRSRFSDDQLAALKDGRPRIPYLTWHHHQDTGRMQLVRSDLHTAVRHVGGNAMWGGR